MLYAAWKEIARASAHETALTDLGSGRRWTFAQLDAQTESLPAPETVVCPAVLGPEFIFDVLRAWRHGRVVCPLEADQASPEVSGLPPGCCHLKTTSGTLGTPQMIVLTASQLAADAINIVATMGLRQDWPNLGLISLAHSYGFSNLVTPLLLHGIPLILAPSRLPEALREAGSQFPNLTLPAVPALWRIWHEAGVIPRSVRLAISAGAPLPVALEKAIFDRAQVKVHNFYGASECGGICYDASPVPRHCDEEVGTPMRNVTLKLDDEGCVTVFSRAVAERYWPESQDTLGGGRFQTSDRGEFHGEGVFLKGRRGEMINLAGRKILPDAIEQLIRQHPGVRECVVFGVPEPGAVRSEALVACVAAEPGVQADDLKKFLLETIPGWQLPRHWWFLPSLSDAHRGKISRAKWRERFLAGQSEKT